MEIWKPWYDDTLKSGLCWFTMLSPGRGGWLERVVRYRTKTLKTSRVTMGAASAAGGQPGPIFRINATMEQRDVAASLSTSPEPDNEAGSPLGYRGYGDVGYPSADECFDTALQVLNADGQHWVDLRNAAAIAANPVHPVLYEYLGVLETCNNPAPGGVATCHFRYSERFWSPYGDNGNPGYGVPNVQYQGMVITECQE